MGVYTTPTLILIIFAIFLISRLIKAERFGENVVILPAIAYIGFFIINSIGMAILMSFDNNYESLVYGFIVSIATFSFIFGYFIIPQKRISRNKFLSLKAFQSKKNSFYKKGFISLFLLVLLFSALYYRGLPQLLIGLFEILSSNDFSSTDSASFLSEQRFMLTKSHLYGGEYTGQGLLHELQQTGWRFVTVFSLIGLIHWKTRFWKVSFVVSLILMILLLAGTGERAPLVFSILILLIVYSLLKKVNFRQFFMFSSIAFILLILTTVLGSRGVSDFLSIDAYFVLLESLFKRIFVGNGIHDYEVIGWVNSDKLEIRYGLFHFEKLISSLPGINVGKPLGIITSELRGSSSRVFSSGTYLGLVYADFAYMGILIVYFFMGLFIRGLTVIILATKKELLNVAFIVLIIFTIGEMASFGFVGFFVQYIIIFSFYMFFKFTGNLLSSNNK
ncbi:MAG: oligosaccharide repeat unit polymerase [Patiriisocius sp.]|jgi:oligosaccharide repeat unit polymerase